MTIGEAIQKARLESGFYNKSEFGRLIGLMSSPGSKIDRWEQGGHIPRCDVLERIKDVTGYDFCTSADGWRIIPVEK